MPEPEATPEFQATADLSPLSPSPLHSAAPAVVPALQDTADILDAMSAQTNGVAPGGVGAPVPVEYNPSVEYQNGTGGDADAQDDADSLNDAYGEEEETGADKVQEQQVEPDDGEDEYLKSFDSPAGGADEDGADQDDVSKARESMHNSAASDTLTSPVTDPSSASNEPAATAAAHQGAESSAAIASSNRRDVQFEDDPASDISRLVAEMTGQASEADNNANPVGAGSASASAQSYDAQSSSNMPSSTPATATLPPRPPLPSQASPTYPIQNLHAVAPPTPGQPSTYVAAGAPGTTPDAYGGALPPPPPTGLNASVPITSMTAPPYPQTNDTTNRQGAWDQFIADERRYMAEAKWDKFPDGSRIFIGSRSLSSGRPDGAIDFFSGNLSSERVSKRDVFDIFSKYGRLAQISLKSAYGFVQYHNLEDAHAAMDNLQGIEIKGRKIHLEFSRAQKKKDNNERNRSPDRSRGGRQSGRQDRQDGGNQNQDRRSRDDYRPGRNSPSRRNNGSYGRDDNNNNSSRDRYQYDDRSRGRSRSPQGHGRHDGYRWREPSPPKAYGHGAANEDRLDLPRRYGSEVPDVQFLLLQDVGNDFVAWVQRAFTDRGLKVAVMFFNPTFPREAVIQRQVVEGVHAIVDLDMQSHHYGKIPLRVFDRSSGVSARYDDYRDLDPPIAAELVLRAKATAAAAAPPPYQGAPPQQPYQGYGGQPYGGPQPPQAHTPNYPGQGPRGPPQAPHPQAPAPAVNAADLASVMNGIDNATLQRLLASIGGQGAANSAAGPPNAQLQALLGSIQTAPPVAPTQPASYGVFPPNGAPAGPPSGNPPSGPGGGDQAAQVQNIMAQLARYRQ
ncbi:RNA-binding protein [Colletotrichum truncatum]|uniref:RNA-binding protein n=1 Tax=Colletotrichum truncatum TaxID=5467 RepID=A0ACC3Z617_COLTU|nr:RNA-binding protein [Colletotrichum truncatum]KAF6787176.1 RNA-binding protein [Colletotrichum truncatum]